MLLVNNYIILDLLAKVAFCSELANSGSSALVKQLLGLQFANDICCVIGQRFNMIFFFILLDIT